MNKEQNSNLLRVVVYGIIFMFMSVIFYNCVEQDIEPFRLPQATPPSGTSEISTFYPDSGGSGTQLIIEGNNFGTDTSYIKVTVNGKLATVIGAANNRIYAVVPARADTGQVKVYIGKSDNIQELAFEDKFRYIFRQNVSTVAGTTEGTDDGEISVAKIQRPSWITFDKDGTLYFVENGEGDAGQGGIRRISSGDIFTLMRTNQTLFKRPRAIHFGSNDNQDTLYVANDRNDNSEDNSNMAVGVMLRGNDFRSMKVHIRGRQNNHVALNPVTKELFYNNFSNGLFYRWDSQEEKREQLFDLDGDNVEFSTVFTKDGKTLYIIIRGQHCIYRGDYNLTTRKVENVRPFAGKWGVNEPKGINGLGEVARFNKPCQGAVDDDNNLYVADRENHCIRKITPEGLVSVWAGVANTSGYKDGNPSEALFNNPEGLAFGPDEALYVGDFDNHKIRKIVVE